MSTEKPQWWFRSIHETQELKSQPQHIEYLKIWTGETFIHSLGTAYWDHDHRCLNVGGLMVAGITHWRVIEMQMAPLVPQETSETETR